jgi:hypothetical protein
VAPRRRSRVYFLKGELDGAATSNRQSPLVSMAISLSILRLQHGSAHVSEAAIETPEYQPLNRVHSVFQPHSEVGQYETHL